MKNILKFAALLLLAGFALTGCETETTPERKIVQHPDDQTLIHRDNAYYARLRAYKQTKHKVAFGWFGSWNPANASKMATLKHAPDSMDIISIWSQWHSLTPAQMKDKEYVQKMKGTKVTFTIFAHDVPEEFKVEGKVTPEGLAAYAKAYAKDSLDKYQYDGIDLDYETGFASGDLLDGSYIFGVPVANRRYNEDMQTFVRELSKWVGPASGTGKLLIIDGVPYGVLPELAPAFDYGIVQAYYSSGYWDLQNRFTDAFDGGWKPEQYIFAEDFEKGWQNGGVNHQLRNGQYVPSLYGMALFDPTQGTGGGFGAYHMEYEYGHNDMVYKYMRQAIQLVNPAPAGDLTKTLVSINEAAEMDRFELSQTPSGHVYGEVSSEITGKLSVVPEVAADLKLTVDNEFVAAYNAENDTEYRTIDPSIVVFSGALHFPAGEQYTDAPVTITIPTINTIENGEYMVVIQPDVAASKGYGINEKAARKILVITKEQTQIKVSVTGGAMSNLTLMQLLDGTNVGEVKAQFGANLSLPALSSFDFAYVADNDLVKAYNEANGTDYMTIDRSKVAVTGKLHAEANATALTGSVEVAVADLTSFQKGITMIALRPDLSAQTDYAADENNGVKYLLVVKTLENVAQAQNLEDFSATTTLIDNTNNKLGWTLDIRNLGPVGGTGVWYFDNDTMFDGEMGGDDSKHNGWYAIYGNAYSWRAGQPDGQVTLDMQNTYTVSTYLWGVCYANKGYAVKTIASVETSLDGKTWTPQNHGNVTVARDAGDDSRQWINFINPVETRYIRIVISEGYSQFSGMAEIQVYAPKN